MLFLLPVFSLGHRDTETQREKQRPSGEKYVVARRAEKMSLCLCASVSQEENRLACETR
jgi:hypothetical protein